MRPTKQVYSDYTTEDFQVWKTLFDRQTKNLEGKVSDVFMEALDRVAFTPEKIPDFKALNPRLASMTGWGLTTVPNISPPATFFNFLANKKFTATCWLRKMEELDYLEEPDMFHDVFGHAPLLSNPDYCEFFQKVGLLALKHIDNEEIVTKLQRLYWFTIEFGLIRENGQLKIYGAGIISSKEETEHALSNRSHKHDFDFEKIFAHDFRTDIIQSDYYVIDSFKELSERFDDVERLLL